MLPAPLNLHAWIDEPNLYHYYQLNYTPLDTESQPATQEEEASPEPEKSEEDEEPAPVKSRKATPAKTSKRSARPSWLTATNLYPRIG